MKTSLKRREYHSYTWKKRELVAVTAQAVGIVLLLAYFFLSQHLGGDTFIGSRNSLLLVDREKEG